MRTLSSASSSRPLPNDKIDSTSSSTGDGSEAEDNVNQSRTQRLKTLFRKHGWTALAVYLLLSALDFGLTFGLIYAVGADRVREAEDWVLDALGWRRKDGEPGKFKKAVDDWKEQHPRKRKPAASIEPKPAVEPNAVATAKPGDSGYSAMATTAALAYVIHKTLLLPVRVGITIAITPKIVRTLQSWGWAVGLAQSGAQAARASKTATGAINGNP